MEDAAVNDDDDDVLCRRAGRTVADDHRHSSVTRSVKLLTVCRRKGKGRILL